MLLEPPKVAMTATDSTGKCPLAWLVKCLLKKVREIEDYEATYAGSVAIVSEEYAGIGVELGVDDAFWPALRRGNALDVGIVGEEMRSISLRGSNDPVRRFVDSCSQIFAEPESSAAPAK